MFKPTIKATPHSETCKAAFGRKDATCPRCSELLAGATPTSWGQSRRAMDMQRVAEIRKHDCKRSGCNVVCTFGDY